MDLIEIEKRLDAALSVFLENDTTLFDDNLGEPVLSHRIGFYLQNLFPNFFVDCEYDKLAGGDKERPNSVIDMRPDIIIHRRLHEPVDNLVVIEVKKGEEPESNDKEKLKIFTDTNGLYRYKYGFFVGFKLVNGKRTPVKRIYENGRVQD
jgi:hypothetical protein